MAIGAKRVETRNWMTAHRGPLAIHAAQGWGTPDRYFSAAAWGYLLATGAVDREAEPFAAWLERIDAERGCVLGTTAVVDVVAVEPVLFGPEWSAQERLFGDFSPGRFAWILSGTFTPVTRPTPAKGALGLWEW